jgi:2'-5' RNA ligase
MQRLFVAIPLTANEEVLKLLATLRKKLQHENFNWVATQNMHLTLKFIGETPSAKKLEIISLLEELIAKHNTFNICMDRTGIFGSRYDPRVLWLGSYEAPQPLVELARQMITSFEMIGFPADRQNFVPHLTLARIKKLNDKQYFQKIIQEIPQKTYLDQKVGSVVLYESILRKEGPVYNKIETFNLSPL